MWIGVGRIVLDFLGNDNFAKKKRELEALCQSLRKKYNISVLEVADFDDAEKCVIGFAAVIPETWKKKSAQELTQEICRTIDATAFARVTVEDWDLLCYGDDEPIDPLDDILKPGPREGSKEWIQQRRRARG